MRQNNIPSKEDFARAKAAMRKNEQGLSEVSTQIKKQFKNNGVHEVFMFFSPKKKSFGAYVFYLMSNQIKESKLSGLEEKIKKVVSSELEKVGRGDKDSLNINFEFDSHQNVEKNYDGDYYDRLR